MPTRQAEQHSLQKVLEMLAHKQKEKSADKSDRTPDTTRKRCSIRSRRNHRHRTRRHHRRDPGRDRRRRSLRRRPRRPGWGSPGSSGRSDRT